MLTHTGNRHTPRHDTPPPAGSDLGPEIHHARVPVRDPGGFGPGVEEGK